MRLQDASSASYAARYAGGLEPKRETWRIIALTRIFPRVQIRPEHIHRGLLFAQIRAQP